MFTGGATVAINLIAEEVVAIDNNPRIINLLEFLKKQDYYKLINKIDHIIDIYGLSNSYKNVILIIKNMLKEIMD